MNPFDAVIMLPLLGAVVGVILALTGAGGSIIAVPMLILGMGWPITQASPVALLAVACSSSIGVALGLRDRIVRYRAAALMALCGFPMTGLGLMAAHRLPVHALTLAFAALLAAVSVRSWRQSRAMPAEGDGDAPGRSRAPCLIDPRTGRFHWTPSCAWALAAAGVLAGFLSGLFGVGGGFLIVPSLRRVTDLAMNAVVATSMMVVMLVSLGAVGTALFAGHLPSSTGLLFVGGAIGGMLVGRTVAARLAGPRLQQGFAVVCLGVAILLVVRTLRP